MKIININRNLDITIKIIRDLILDAGITDKDTLLLNQEDFDNISLEHRTTYKESLHHPFFLLNVLIKEDYTHEVPLRKIGIIKNDTARYNEDYKMDSSNSNDENYKYETIYRCGWCGNIVDFDGKQLDSEVRLFKIRIYEKFNATVTVNRVHGYCCPQGNN